MYLRYQVDTLKTEYVIMCQNLMFRISRGVCFQALSPKFFNTALKIKVMALIEFYLFIIK